MCNRNTTLLRGTYMSCSLCFVTTWWQHLHLGTPCTSASCTSYVLSLSKFSHRHCLRGGDQIFVWC
jgi:hypothetical protein